MLIREDVETGHIVRFAGAAVMMRLSRSGYEFGVVNPKPGTLVPGDVKSPVGTNGTSRGAKWHVRSLTDVTRSARHGRY
jgi:hypothetical protein